MDSISKIFIAIFAIMTMANFLFIPTSAEEEIVYLGDRKDLMMERDYEDSIGWNTAHSGEKITVWDLSFEKGIGFHCRQYGDAYIEFDISSLDMNYFYATVGVLKDATYYIDEGSISFSVYGDGKLLATTPVINWGKKPTYICVPVTGVKTLRLVENNAGSWVCDAGVWGDAALSKKEPSLPEWMTKFDPNNTDKAQEENIVSGDYAYVSDLYFQTYTGEAECRDCNTAGELIVSTDEKYFAKGIGFHAGVNGYSTYIDVNIEGLGYKKFASYYGISETVSKYDISMANIKFAVFGDGKKLFESGAVKYGQPMQKMECDVSGVKCLRLAIAGNPNIDGGWGTWGGAILSKSGNFTDEMFYTPYYIKPDHIGDNNENPSENGSANDNTAPGSTEHQGQNNQSQSENASAPTKTENQAANKESNSTLGIIITTAIVTTLILCMGFGVFYVISKRRRG